MPVLVHCGDLQVAVMFPAMCQIDSLSGCVHCWVSTHMANAHRRTVKDLQGLTSEVELA